MGQRSPRRHTTQTADRRNLVVYAKDGHANWAAGTNNKNPGWLVLGTDGSLRLYHATGQQIWAA
ncbi:hypothetical protein ACFT7S_07915 [Streptomyces sp. NPDC057136]|uniref:hypothetical protein n=1 Tax=Streptomyces sp. NPDC057136 TaxID=3346029 RepID=UPI003636E2CB